MKEIAIVPARKGSKRLKNKNILEINGKTLINISFKTLMDQFNYLWLNSDCKNYINYINTKKINFHLRPKNLGGDLISTDDVIKEWIEFNKIEYSSLIYVFQPTSIFRNIKFLEQFKKEARKLSFGESLISVSNIKKLSVMDNDYIKGYNYKFGERSQDINKKKYYKENGLGYASHVDTILECGLFGRFSKPFISDDYCFDIDIDTEEDFINSKTIIENGI